MMMQWLPLWLVDKILLIFAWLVFGNTEKWGLKRPLMGPLQLKYSEGKTPVLDIGALRKIRSGEIKVVPGIKRFSDGSVELVNGERHDIDAVILATGYRSNVPSWLKVRKCSEPSCVFSAFFFFFSSFWFFSFFLFFFSGRSIL